MHNEHLFLGPNNIHEQKHKEPRNVTRKPFEQHSRLSFPLLKCALAGLATAVKMLEPLKAKYPLVGYADLFQMASAVAIESVCTPFPPFSFHDAQPYRPISRLGELVEYR
jgi:hypothetical protein